LILVVMGMHERSPQILLVEEDKTLLDIERALEWLRENLPTLVIVDQVLPGMDGVEFINRLSNDTRTSEIPIMFLSTNADLEDVQRAYNAGADEYLVIPYDPLVLEAKVERLVNATAQTE
jgi:DNA-binding response OmpR family regulator